MRKSECEDSDNCKWIPGKGCRKSTYVENKDKPKPCSQMRKSECEDSDNCKWIPGKGCRKSTYDSNDTKENISHDNIKDEMKPFIIELIHTLDIHEKNSRKEFYQTLKQKFGKSTIKQHKPYIEKVTRKELRKIMKKQPIIGSPFVVDVNEKDIEKLSKELKHINDTNEKYIEKLSNELKDINTFIDEQETDDDYESDDVKFPETLSDSEKRSILKQNNPNKKPPLLDDGLRIILSDSEVMDVLDSNYESDDVKFPETLSDSEESDSESTELSNFKENIPNKKPPLLDDGLRIILSDSEVMDVLDSNYDSDDVKFPETLSDSDSDSEPKLSVNEGIIIEKNGNHPEPKSTESWDMIMDVDNSSPGPMDDFSDLEDSDSNIYNASHGNVSLIDERHIASMSIGIILSSRNDNKYFMFKDDFLKIKHEFEKDTKNNKRIPGKIYNGIRIVAEYYQHKFIKDQNGDLVDILVVNTETDMIDQYLNYINGGAKQFEKLLIKVEPYLIHHIDKNDVLEKNVFNVKDVVHVTKSNPPYNILHPDFKRQVTIPDVLTDKDFKSEITNMKWDSVNNFVYSNMSTKYNTKMTLQQSLSNIKQVYHIGMLSEYSNTILDSIEKSYESLLQNPYIRSLFSITLPLETINFMKTQKMQIIKGVDCDVWKLYLFYKNRSSIYEDHSTITHEESRLYFIEQFTNTIKDRVFETYLQHKTQNHKKVTDNILSFQTNGVYDKLRDDIFGLLLKGNLGVKQEFVNLQKDYSSLSFLSLTDVLVSLLTFRNIVRFSVDGYMFTNVYDSVKFMMFRTFGLSQKIKSNMTSFLDNVNDFNKYFGFLIEQINKDEKDIPMSVVNEKHTILPLIPKVFVKRGVDSDEAYKLVSHIQDLNFNHTDKTLTDVLTVLGTYEMLKNTSTSTILYMSGNKNIYVDGKRSMFLENTRRLLLHETNQIMTVKMDMRDNVFVDHWMSRMVTIFKTRFRIISKYLPTLPSKNKYDIMKTIFNYNHQSGMSYMKMVAKIVYSMLIRQNFNTNDIEDIIRKLEDRMDKTEKYIKLSPEEQEEYEQLNQNPSLLPLVEKLRLSSLRERLELSESHTDHLNEMSELERKGITDEDKFTRYNYLTKRTQNHQKQVNMYHKSQTKLNKILQNEKECKEMSTEITHFLTPYLNKSDTLYGTFEHIIDIFYTKPTDLNLKQVVKDNVTYIMDKIPKNISDDDQTVLKMIFDVMNGSYGSTDTIDKKLACQIDSKQMTETRKSSIDTNRYKDIYNTTKHNSNIIMTLNDINHRLPYKSNQKTIGTHLGQRKLFLSEVQFLSYCLKSTQVPNNLYCVYAGSAPGQKTHLLSKIFPTVKFILVDPAKADIVVDGKSHRDFKHNDVVHLHHKYPTLSNTYSTDNKEIVQMTPEEKSEIMKFIESTQYKIYIIEDLMTEDIANMLSEFENTVYISDIRSNMFNEDFPTDTDIYFNHALNYNVMKIMNPYMSMIKFRIPFFNDYEKDMERMKELSHLFERSKEFGIDFIEDFKNRKLNLPVSSDLYVQAWAKPSSTELRMYVPMSGIHSIQEYDIKEIEEKMNSFNMINRTYVCHVNSFVNDDLGICNCNDCSLETHILSQVTSDTFGLVRELNTVTGKSLKDFHWNKYHVLMTDNKAISVKERIETYIRNISNPKSYFSILLKNLR